MTSHTSVVSTDMSMSTSTNENAQARGMRASMHNAFTLMLSECDLRFRVGSLALAMQMINRPSRQGTR